MSMKPWNTGVGIEWEERREIPRGWKAKVAFRSLKPFGGGRSVGRRRRVLFFGS